MENKKIITVEGDVVFMTDPNIEFVSLVKHGANQTPFKVLKTRKGTPPELDVKGGPGSGPRAGVDAIVIEKKTLSDHSEAINSAYTEIESKKWGEPKEPGEPWTQALDRYAIASNAITEIRDGSSGIILKDHVGESVGVSSFSISKKDSTLFVDYLATREKGYGRKTMQEIAKVATKNECGIELLALQTAVGFYKKIGMHSDGNMKQLFRFSPSETKAFAESGKIGKQDDNEPDDGCFCVPRGTVFQENKSRIKESDMKEKVIQAVLVPKSLAAEVSEKSIKDYRTDEVKEYDSYKSFIQVSMDEINEDSVEVITLDKDNMILGIVGSLKSDFADPPQKKDAKGTVDYVTLDNLYEQLYAMCDIVSGSLRQDTEDAKARVDYIMSAIDNFKTFASMVLSADKSGKGVDPNKFPALAFPLIRATTDEKEDNVNQEKIDAIKAEIRAEVTEILSGQKAVTAADVKAAVEEATKTLKAEFDGSIGTVTESLKLITDSAKQLTDSLADLGKRIDPLEGFVAGQKSSLKTQKSLHPEGIEKAQKEPGVFNGLLFARTSGGEQ